MSEGGITVDFRLMSNITSSLKMTDMKNKWKQKQKSGDYKADGTSGLKDWLEKKKRESEQILKNSGFKSEDDKDNDKYNSLITKYRAGGKLSDSEMEYIRKKSPLVYKQIKSNEEEVKRYEESLKKCRSKQEVQRLKMSHIGASLSGVNAVKNSPYVTASDKAAFASNEQRKLNDIDRITVKFVRSEKYKKLRDEYDPDKKYKYKKDRFEQELEKELLRDEKTEAKVEEIKDKTENSDESETDVSEPLPEKETAAAEKEISASENKTAAGEKKNEHKADNGNSGEELRKKRKIDKKV